MANGQQSTDPPAWRRKESYEYVLSLPREKLAAEFMRRNPRFDRAWRDRLSRQSTDDTGSAVKVQRLRERNTEAEGWGLLSFPFRRKGFRFRRR